MALSIYKPGQGKYTRLSTAAGLGALTLWCAGWLWEELQGSAGANSVFVQAGVAAGLIIFVGVFSWWLLNKVAVADFMIATESEMRKVNWPSRKEIIGSTWIVICGTALMAMLLFAINLFFGWFFQQIHILEG